MAGHISTLGIMLASINRLGSSQAKIAELSEQLSSKVKSNDLTQYSAQEAKTLLNLNAIAMKKEGYLNVIESVATRIKIYDEALTGIEDTVGESVTLATASAAYNADTNATTAAQIKGYIERVEYFLNLEVGDRYIFSGTRYDTAPVADLSGVLATYPVSGSNPNLYLTTAPTLPQYDAEYAGVGSVSAQSYIEDSAIVDTSTTVTYGISSNDDSFQRVILGLRYAYAATQDSTNYNALMATAKDLLTTGNRAVQSVHTDLVSDQIQIDAVKGRLENSIRDAENQIDDIRNVDTNEVTVKITALQTTMEAAYSATAILEKLTILDYL